MRTADFDFYGGQGFGPYDFMSNSGGKWTFGWTSGAVKTPVMAMDTSGTIYGFWLYPDTVDNTEYLHVYYNENINFDWGTEDTLEIFDNYNTYGAFSICSLSDPNGDINLVMGLKLTPLDASVEVYHCWYDVSADEWSDLEIVSEISEPDGNNSILPYLAFREVTNGYKMYVVWEEDIPQSQKKQVKLRIYDSNSNIWDTEILIADKYAEKPSVAVQTNGDIYVVWEDIFNSDEWIYYKCYDNSSSTWSSVQRVTDNQDLNWLHVPTIIRDRWDNLHLSALGEVDSLDASDFYEVFYSFYDAPPHIEDLEFVASVSDEDSVVISWTGWAEPDLDTYKIYRKYLGQSWEFVDSTNDTRYSDTESSYSPSGFSQIDY